MRDAVAVEPTEEVTAGTARAVAARAHSAASRLREGTGSPAAEGRGTGAGVSTTSTTTGASPALWWFRSASRASSPPEPLTSACEGPHVGAARADPRGRHRRERGAGRAVRAAPDHVRRLHRVGTRAELRRGLPARRGAAGLCEHPHREL